MVRPYDRDIYSRHFARLLNQALKSGGGDPQQALDWLQSKYHLTLTLLFSRHRLEISDAFMDVREHIVKRIAENEKQVES